MGTVFEEAIIYLEELGLTQYEAKVYLALIGEHPAGAYAVSQRSGVPHSRVYEVARRLIKKGLVILVDKNPERFSPLAPIEFIDKLERDHRRVIGELKTKFRELSFQSDFDPVWNIVDRDGAMEKAQEIIRGAKKRIFIGIWDEEFPELIEDVRTAHSRGVEIVFLIYGKREVDFGRVFYHNTEALDDVAEFGRTIDVIADSLLAISGRLGGGPNNNGSETIKEARFQSCQVVWTKNQGLINAIEGYIIHDFYLAEIMEVKGDEIEQIFGKNIVKLRKKYR